MMKKILVIEDELDIARLLELHLSDAGFEVSLATDGEGGLRIFGRDEIDLVVLDLMLPGIDGLETCKRLRERSDYVPILMLTARSGEVDRVVGLESGADDYLTKPFSVRELVARVRAILRRADAMAELGIEASDTLRFGALSIDAVSREVRLGGGDLSLTAKEFDLLHHFASHPGRVFTRAQLLDAVWGYSYSGYEHTVNSHINRLRAKVEEDPGNPLLIRTVWGVGYKFAPPQGEGRSTAMGGAQGDDASEPMPAPRRSAEDRPWGRTRPGRGN